MAYTGTSIVDYLKSIGQDSSFASRSTLAQQKGISNYTGSAQQNQQLLGYLNTPNIPASFTPPTNQTYQYPAENTGTNGGNVIAGIQAQLDAITKMAADIQKNGETSSSTNGQPTKPQSLSAAETQQTSLWDKITSAASSILGTKQEVSTMGEQFDLTGQVKAINDNALEMANKMAQYKQAVSDLEGKPIPIENINAEKESLQRKYAIDIGVTQAYGEALQGNYERSKSAIDDIIKLKLEPQEQELENLKMFYNMNESVLSNEQSKYANEVQQAIKTQEAKLKATKDNYDSNVSLYMQIANSGGASQLKNFDFDAPVDQNLVKYGAGLKNITTVGTEKLTQAQKDEQSALNDVRTAFEVGDVGPGSTYATREDLIKAVIKANPSVEPQVIKDAVYNKYFAEKNTNITSNNSLPLDINTLGNFNAFSGSTTATTQNSGGFKSLIDSFYKNLFTDTRK